MIFKSLLLTTLAFSFSALAAVGPSQSSDQFCADRSDSKFSKELIGNYQNLMAFANEGGIGNGGVCWWHSRFQRSAAYLTIFKPSEDHPSKSEAEKIITKIRLGKEIITIPGFRNFNEFSRAYRREIQSELDKWQKLDGVVKFNWAVGLSGSNVVPAETLKSMMDELYEYVEGEGNIAYQKLQIKGITAHAWLVVNMSKTKNGYELEVLDSNYPNQTQSYRYQEGMTNFRHPYYGEFTPYLERKGEMDTIKLAIMKKCNPVEYKALKDKQDEERRKANENYGA